MRITHTHCVPHATIIDTRGNGSSSCLEMAQHNVHWDKKLICHSRMAITCSYAAMWLSPSHSLSLSLSLALSLSLVS